MNTAETELLFSDEPLIPVPVIRSVVGIPITEMPSAEEYDLLSKILKALTLKHGMYRFVFYTGLPEEMQIAEEDVLILQVDHAAWVADPPRYQSPARTACRGGLLHLGTRRVQPPRENLDEPQRPHPG